MNIQHTGLQHRYLPTEMFVVKSGRLYNIVEEVVSGELYVKLGDRELLLYRVDLDEPVMSIEEAAAIYPEEFI